MKRLLFVPFDQLNAKYGLLAKADKANDLVVMVESNRMLTGRNWNPNRLHFLVSSARHFAKELKNTGFQVEYLKAPDTPTGLTKVLKANSEAELWCAEPSSYEQTRQLTRLGAKFVSNDFFLTPRELFFSWAEKQKSFVMENFYRQQRIRLQILVEGQDPVGGRWNFDADNRLPPPKNYSWKDYSHFETDEVDREVAKELGFSPTGLWGTTRAQALKRLKDFLKDDLANFGPYEDAVTSESWKLHHSVLSPYLNNGLLHASEVVTGVLKSFNSGNIPLQSAEGFIRQLIGWREYINGMYWFLGEGYKQQNGLGAKRRLLPLYNDPTKTKMNCVASEVSAVLNTGWTHHIPRLMILSNLALITGSNPQAFLDWMREQFVDAADWVMVPNVIGMGLHADGGRLMTKPYASGGSYISKMTNYCKGCHYDPKKRVGEAACPFTTLYWDFLERNKSTFSANHRMSQQLAGLSRLSDLAELKVRAKEVLAGLDNGQI